MNGSSCPARCISEVADMIEIRHVQVKDVLRARDERVNRQNGFLGKYGVPLVSFTMNIAGSIKNDAAIHRAFCEGKRRILRQLERMDAVVLDYAEAIEYTGALGSGRRGREAEGENVCH